MAERHPFSLEEAFFKIVWDAMDDSDVVLFDDLHLLSDALGGGPGCSNYPRSGYLSLPLTVLIRYAQERNKCLVFSSGGMLPRPLSEWANSITIGDFLPAFDKARGKPIKPPTDYFLAAAQTVRQNKQRYAEAEAQAAARPRAGNRPPWFDVDFAELMNDESVIAQRMMPQFPNDSPGT